MRADTAPRSSLSTLTLALLVLGFVPGVQAQPTNADLVASGLFGSTGLTIDEAGRIWATEPGTGSDDARVVVLTPGGQIEPFVEGLPSSLGVEGPEGANHLLFDGADLWVAVGTGAVDPRSVVYRFDASGFTAGDPPLSPSDAELTVDVGAFVIGEGFAETNVYGLALGPAGTLYMTDASANAVLSLAPDTTLSVVATLDDIPNPTPVGPPTIQAVPTGIAYEQGTIYVASFTGFPFVEGLSSVYAIGLQGDVSVFRDSLTSAVDLTEDPRDRALTVLQHGVYDVDTGVFLPGTGLVLRLDDDVVLSSGFDSPSAMAYSNEGDLYVVTLPGEVYRIVSTPVANEPGAGGAGFTLHPASPNPSDGRATLRYDAGEAGDVRLAVYDVLGREVALLADGPVAAGSHEVVLDGARLPSGTYLVRLEAGGHVQARRVTLVR